MKTAFITGVAGQDGYYLASSLLADGYEVHGTVLPGVPAPADLSGRISLHKMDLRAPALLGELVRTISPLEIYYLAAHHFSSQGDENAKGLAAPFLAVNVVAPNIILEQIKCKLPKTRFFYAASSHIFGAPESFPQTESATHRPNTPYAISKSAGVMLCRYYRETHGLHVSTGILYNHESPFRSADFVTTRIARAAALASIGKKEPVYFENLSAVVDWGAAKDYVAAMCLLLQQPCGGEYIISSGVPRTVLEFAEAAFKCVGLKPDGIILQEDHPAQASRVPYVGDSSKIRKLCGWVPATPFKEMVREMVTAQLALLRD
ncbi:MAG: GDP-mannose 4,6-dehydratase [Elusimicrobia bacterium]|nr:GDP-mannose 4,6-dehydratase [Elusimicrobiota bacterium]